MLWDCGCGCACFGFHDTDVLLNFLVQIWIIKQGWLSKRASGRMTSGHWQRRWFVLQSDGSLYHLSSRNGEDRKAVANLCISTIKSDLKEKERASFCLVSPTHTYCLQAENELERQEWINSIQVCGIPALLVLRISHWQ
jgi:Arf-GAP with coiled-coil, ANK repeat and PH domain-containing protein